MTRHSRVERVAYTARMAKTTVERLDEYIRKNKYKRWETLSRAAVIEEAVKEFLDARQEKKAK